MKKIFYIVSFILSFTCLQAQYKVTFILKEQTVLQHDSIYVTGSFSNWDSTANLNYLMKPHGRKEKFITLNVKAGPLKYKFHRGSWFEVEKQFDGTEVSDREINIRNDTTLVDNVFAWRDQFFVDKWLSLSHQLPDTSRLKILMSLSNFYAFYFDDYNSDSAFYYAQQSVQLVQKMKVSNNYKQWFTEGNSGVLINIQETIASLLHSLGNYPGALQIRLENLKLAEKEKDRYLLLAALGNITGDYLSMKDYQSMLHYAKQQDSVLATLNTKDERYPLAFFTAKYNVAIAWYKLNNFQLAIDYEKQGIEMMGSVKDVWRSAWLSTTRNLLLGDVYASMHQNDSALYHYRSVINSNLKSYLLNFTARAEAGMARVFQRTNHLDSGLFYGRQALAYFQNNNTMIQAWGENSLYYVGEISPLLAELYRSNNQPDSAYKYLQLSIVVKDSLYNSDKVRQFQTLGFNEANRRTQIEQQSREEKQRYDTKIKMYGLVSIITGFIILAFILYRNNRHKQNANILLQSQKVEIEKTLSELKVTQKQLVQSEKMASLGELTAGIAHEIQNPLNFVNNFSEVNKELLVEMKEELEKGNVFEVKALADDVIDNEDKIIFHGKRADAIVKGMLQHSRSSSALKEATDINALCDEYLRLSYHGLRAKDKSFNATMKTDFDALLEKVNIIPQDIGRVVLNLLTNAFYAVDEKKKSGVENFEPTVSIRTKKLGDKVEISVIDNGNGIPQNVLDKIFQPFFTTKPTGKGTGLGLSLSYDIVKAHGGELLVETQEGEGTTFIIYLIAKI